LPPPERLDALQVAIGNCLAVIEEPWRPSKGISREIIADRLVEIFQCSSAGLVFQPDSELIAGIA
jgi:hypothetical protein